MPVDHDSALKISTLGGLSIQLAGRRIEFATRKAEALLVYLASLRRDHPREILATMLWAEQSQTQALTSLRTALANLRKHLRPYIHATRSTIGLQETNIWFDIAALEQHLKNAEIEAAMALYQGEFLEGFYVRSAATFENWQVAERERIHQLVRQGLHDHISRSISTAQFAAGLASARQLLDLDPLDELAQQQMKIGRAHV